MAEDNLASAANEKAPPRSARPASLIPVLLGFLFLAVIAVAAFLTQRGINNSTNWVVHTYDVRGELQNLRTQLAEIRVSALAYSGSGDETERQVFRQHSEYIEKASEHLRKLTADNARQQERLSELQSLSRNYVAQLQRDLAPGVQPNSDLPAKLAAIREFDSQESQVDRLVIRMEEEEISLLSRRLGTWNREFWRTSVVLTLALFAALGFLAYNFRLLSREIVRTRELELIQRENVLSSRALSARILDLQDAERRRIARELHDSVGQYLVGLKINLEQLLGSRANLTSAHENLLAQTIELAERSMLEVRTISHLLHPPLLDEVGLESAIRWYADGFALRSALKVSLHLDSIINRLPKEVELALFRVLQESLTNVHRHANAKSIEVVLTCSSGHIVLSVIDDGVGMAAEVLTRFSSGRASGVGLAGMRERLAELDGTLEVERASRGTAVRATIPVEQCASQHKPLGAV
ncbi:MAG TPA: ATP-binding protein [Candidatus Acidoferrum sp.]|jgi:signal transduction histidine kinase|nr:ATP-binding protein [Candidatus Acidoferrum sp.]